MRAGARRRAGPVREHGHGGDDARGQTRPPRERLRSDDHQGVARLPRLLRRPRGRACRARARCPGGSRSRRFGELDSYEAQLQRFDGEVAAIVVEPVQYTGIVTPPPEGFLAEPAARSRVRPGCCSCSTTASCSASPKVAPPERFGLEPADITCLGKWIGGGLPVGAITASAELMSDLRPLPDRRWSALPRRIVQREPARDGRRRRSPCATSPLRRSHASTPRRSASRSSSRQGRATAACRSGSAAWARRSVCTCSTTPGARIDWAATLAAPPRRRQQRHLLRLRRRVRPQHGDQRRGAGVRRRSPAQRPGRRGRRRRPAAGVSRAAGFSGGAG